MRRKFVVAYLVAIHLGLLGSVGAIAAKRTGLWNKYVVPPLGTLQAPDYLARRELLASLQLPSGSTVYVGDSLTHMGEWSLLLQDRSAANFGIGGDTTAGVLNRIGDIAKHKPARVLMMVGVNDLAEDVELDAARRNYQTAIHRLRAESPSTQVFVMSVLPVARSYANVMNPKIRAFNSQLRAMAPQEGATFLDIHEAFVDASGKLDARYTWDGLHLNAAGYARWRERLKAAL